MRKLGYIGETPLLMVVEDNTEGSLGNFNERKRYIEKIKIQIVRKAKISINWHFAWRWKFG